MTWPIALTSIHYFFLFPSGKADHRILGWFGLAGTLRDHHPLPLSGTLSTRPGVAQSSTQSVLKHFQYWGIQNFFVPSVPALRHPLCEELVSNLNLPSLSTLKSSQAKTDTPSTALYVSTSASRIWFQMKVNSVCPITKFNNSPSGFRFP